MITTSRWLHPGLLPVRAAGSFCLGLMGGVLLSSGTELSTNTGDYSIDIWQVEHGLPQISITSIAQTPDGYLWLGTFNGLVRFDGMRFTIFDEGNTPALGSSRIIRLCVDEQGTLWIINEAGGLANMAQGQFAKCARQHGLPDCGASALARDPQKRLLVVARDYGLHAIEHGRLFPACEAPAERKEPTVLLDDNGHILVAHQGRATVAARQPIWLSSGQSNNAPVEWSIRGAAQSRQGGYWLATTGGVVRYHGNQLQLPVISLPEQLTRLDVMLEDSYGNLWLGTLGRGLFRYEPIGKWSRFSAQNSLAHDYISAIFEDREGNLWIGTSGGGLHRFKLRRFRMVNTRADVAANTITSVTTDPTGGIWAGVNGGGLNYWDGACFAPVATEAPLSRQGFVYSVLADRQGSIWLGLYRRGALQWEQGQVSARNSDEVFAASTPWVFLEDRTGAIWVGSTKGLQRFADGRSTSYTRQQGLSYEDVHALAEDRSGTLFIGTDGGGLCYLRDGRFGCYTADDGLGDNHVGALFVDGEDTLWIGTVNGGLSRFKDGRFAKVTTRDGLRSNTVGPVLEDDLGNLWLGSNRGIMRLRCRELNDYLDGRRRQFEIDHFNQSDGLSTIACTGSGQPAACKTRDGRLWFATAKGVAVVDPLRLPSNRVPPPVVIEEVLLDDTLVTAPYEASSEFQVTRTENQGRAIAVPKPMGRPQTKILTVPPRTQRVEFRFTALSLVAPEKVRFRCRLDPFEEAWVEMGTRRSAHYTQLPPGTYRFLVSACNNDGVWNDTGASVELAVRPVWWATWWFRGFMLAGASGLVLGWYELRLRRLQRERAVETAFARRLIDSQEEERKRIAAELHDSLGQDLLVIKNRTLLGLREPATAATAAEQLGEISRMASQTLENVREISRNLRPYQIDRLGLTKALESMAQNVARSSGLPCIVVVPEMNGLLESQSEIHFYRIAQELLNNVVKHSDASECRMSVEHGDGRIILCVEDDGRGFDVAATFKRAPSESGFGLNAITERVRMLRGTWHCDSQPGQGTRWRIEIPSCNV